MAFDLISYIVGKSDSAGAQPSGNLGYQVTFKVDDDDYYIVSCQQGESITEPPTPTVQTGYTFAGWKDANNNLITFPYTPNADIELTAKVVSGNFYVNNNELVCTLAGVNVTAISSTNNNICAIGKIGSTYMSAIIISKTDSDAKLAFYIGSQRYSSSAGTVTYNNETYYVSCTNRWGEWIGAADTSGLKRYEFTTKSGYSQTDIQSAALEVLNALFGS